jgi:hypothetical protein
MLFFQPRDLNVGWAALNIVVDLPRYLSGQLWEDSVTVMPWTLQGGHNPGDVLYGMCLACALMWVKLTKSNLRER